MASLQDLTRSTNCISTPLIAWQGLCLKDSWALRSSTPHRSQVSINFAKSSSNEFRARNFRYALHPAQTASRAVPKLSLTARFQHVVDTLGDGVLVSDRSVSFRSSTPLQITTCTNHKSGQSDGYHSRKTIADHWDSCSNRVSGNSVLLWKPYFEASKGQVTTTSARTLLLRNRLCRSDFWKLKMKILHAVCTKRAVVIAKSKGYNYCPSKQSCHLKDLMTLTVGESECSDLANRIAVTFLLQLSLSLLIVGLGTT